MMAEECCFPKKDTVIVNPSKKSPLLLKMAALAASMVCSIFVCSLFLNKMETPSELHTVRVNLTKEVLSHDLRINLTKNYLPSEEGVNLTEKIFPSEERVNLIEKNLPDEDRVNLVEKNLPREVRVNLIVKSIPSEERTNLTEKSIAGEKGANLIEKSFSDEVRVKLTEKNIASEEGVNLDGKNLPREERVNLIVKSIPIEERINLTEKSIASEKGDNLIEKSFSDEVRVKLTEKNISSEEGVNLAAKNFPSEERVNLTEKTPILAIKANSTEINFPHVMRNNVSEKTLLHAMKVNLTEKHLPDPKVSQSQLLSVDYSKNKSLSSNEHACMPVSLYAIVSAQRSGSKWFEALLNSHDNIRSHGEIFYNVDRKCNMTVIRTVLDKVYSLKWNVSTFRRKKKNCLAAVGFKWMLNQGILDNYKGIVDYLNSRGVSVILLFRRNHLRRLVSHKANNHDGLAKGLNGSHKAHVNTQNEADILASYKPKLNIRTLIPTLEHMERLVTNTLNNFKSTRHIVVYYEDLVQNQTQTMMEVLDFLKVSQRKLISGHVKIHTRPLSQQIENWSAVAKAIKRSKYRRFITINDYEL